MINVQTYGALGDGITDDMPAFNAALAAGNRVYVPYTPAGYLLNGSMNLSNQGLVGDTSTKLIHNSNNTLFNINGNNVSIDNFIIDSNNSTNAVFVINNVSTIENIKITNIMHLNGVNLLQDAWATQSIKKLHVQNIISMAPKWKVITLTGYLEQASFNNIKVDYTNSISPDFPAINLMGNNSIFTSCMVDTIDIRGSDNASYSNQHGLVLGTAEHTNISNISCIYMGGSGFIAQNTINFRLENSNFSFNHCDQIVLNACSYCTISNCMTRGRANGSLSPLNSSTYGVSLHSSGAINISNCDIKSCGSGLWIDNSFAITCTGGQSCVHTYYGIISTGTTANSNINGMSFTYNGLHDVMHTGSKQYTISCMDSSGNIFNLLGIGTH